MQDVMSSVRCFLEVPQLCWSTLFRPFPFMLSVCLHTGSFHLIHLMFDDYVLYLLESLHCQERANDLMRAMKGEGSTGEAASSNGAPPFDVTLNSRV